MEYYVFVTNNCNLDCQYCCGVGIIKNSSKAERPQYSLEELKSFFISTQERYNSENIDVIFFGGEPTLNLGYIEEFVAYFGFSLNSYNINYALHTNGTLLYRTSRELLNSLKLIIISINYDKIPKSGLYESYFSNIITNIKNIRAVSSTNLLCRLTITESVSLYTNVMQVSSFFDYVYWQLQHCSQFSNYDVFSNNYKYELGLVLDHWYGYFKKGFLINYVPFANAVKSLINANNESVLCGFNTRCINIQTDGKCYSCPESMNDERFFIGDIRGGIQFSKFSMGQTKCMTCDLLSYCCGRCGRMHIVYDEKHIEEYCNLTREMFTFFKSRENEILSIMKQYPEFQESLNDSIYDYTEYIP